MAKENNITALAKRLKPFIVQTINSAVTWFDEGLLAGSTSLINVTGSGGSVAISGGTAVLNIAGGVGNVSWYDEGSLAGTAATANITGAGGSVSVSGGTATLTITSGAGYYPEFVPVMEGWNITTSAAAAKSVTVSGYFGITLDTSQDIQAYGYFKTPAGYTGDLTITPVGQGTGGTGNIYARSRVSYGWYLDNSGVSGSNPDSGLVAVNNPVSSGAYLFSTTYPLTYSVTKETLVQMVFLRNASNANDSFNQGVNFMGWKVEYG